MGNTQTNLPIDSYFLDQIIPDPSPVKITVNINPPAINKGHHQVTKVLLDINSKLTLKESTEDIGYVWSPKSHMRDFEVTDPFTPDEFKIARGQGIGVIILEPLQTYIKLMYDHTAINGIKPILYSIWNHSPEARKLLTTDLSLGYDVLFITNKGIINLCEPLDDRDQRMTRILFSEDEKYAQYNITP